MDLESRCCRLAGDEGAGLVVSVIMMASVLIVAAVVVDLGALRAMNRINQGTADLAALAAGDSLSSVDGINPVEACLDAVTYIRHNAPGLSGELSLPCDSLPSGCSEGTEPVEIRDLGTAAPYRVAITYPVSPTMIADHRTGGSYITDGIRCERMKVTVSRTFPGIFSGAVGAPHLTSSASAVVRRESAEKLQVPNLWLLDPTGCPALSVQGGSRVTVGDASLAGLIAIDSTGTTCSNNAYTIDAGGAGTQVRAVPTSGDKIGTISLVAMLRGQVNCSTGNPNACDTADVSGGLIQPQPTRRRYRATRAPVDHRYNCKASYPAYHGVNLYGCADAATRPPYIDQLRAQVGASGSIAGFARFSSTYSCADPVTPAPLVGNWWVDCPTLKLTNGKDLVFSGGNVVFDGDVNMSGGSLNINTANTNANLSPTCQSSILTCISSSSAGAAFAYFRNGGIRMTGGALQLVRTAVYQANGDFQIAGGAPPTWSAPSEGPLAGLAVWSEAPSTGFRINGGASMSLDGVFFTPEADAFQISGGSPVTPQRAQFISYRLAVTGGASLTLTPDLIRLVTLPPPAPKLIR